MLHSNFLFALSKQFASFSLHLLALMSSTFLSRFVCLQFYFFAINVDNLRNVFLQIVLTVDYRNEEEKYHVK